MQEKRTAPFEISKAVIETFRKFQRRAMEKSFAPLESRRGEDEPLTNETPDLYPYNTICRLSDWNLPAIASGIAISEHVVLTAGHNLENDSLEEPPQFTIEPGFHEAPAIPQLEILDFLVHEKWITERNPFFDVALIYTDRNLPHWFPQSPKTLFASEISWMMAFGYHEDAPSVQSFSYGTILERIDSIAGYDAITKRGQSGGPIFTFVDDEIHLIATHIGDEAKAAEYFMQQLKKGIEYAHEIHSWIEKNLNGPNRNFV